LRGETQTQIIIAMCKVLVVDDHPLFRDALKTALAVAFEKCEPVEAANLDEAAKALRDESDVELVLLDLSMPGVNGFGGLLTLRAQFPAIPIVIVSAHEDRKLVYQAIDYGASGFIPKSTPRDEMVCALRTVIEGNVYIPPQLRNDKAATEAGDENAEVARRLATLTAQQLKVLEMLGTGKLNKEIAYELNIAETTVKAHVSAILQKLKVYSRTQAVVFASRLKLDHFQDAR
jgi:DNA-binding NarL/FixJ family response regulator